MNRSSKSAAPGILPSEVWGYLSSEHRAKVIQLMAQLAFNLLKAQVDFASEEATNVNRPNAQQDPSRPS